MTRALLAVLVAAACSGAGGHAPLEPSPPPVLQEADAGIPAPDAGPPLDELTARVILSERFRRAGYRVRHDVRVVADGRYDVTLDGFDPERGVGFEYVAAEEVGLELDEAQLLALRRAADVRVLVLGPTDEATLRREVEAFLAALAAP